MYNTLQVRCIYTQDLLLLQVSFLYLFSTCYQAGACGQNV